MDRPHGLTARISQSLINSSGVLDAENANALDENLQPTKLVSFLTPYKRKLIGIRPSVGRTTDTDSDKLRRLHKGEVVFKVTPGCDIDGACNAAIQANSDSSLMSPMPPLRGMTAINGMPEEHVDTRPTTGGPADEHEDIVETRGVIPRITVLGIVSNHGSEAEDTYGGLALFSHGGLTDASNTHCNQLRTGSWITPVVPKESDAMRQEANRLGFRGPNAKTTSGRATLATAPMGDTGYARYDRLPFKTMQQYGGAAHFSDDDIINLIDAALVHGETRARRLLGRAIEPCKAGDTFYIKLAWGAY